ncbi:hypothetical protein Lal_00024927 [Lupinus albus]|nr:hypothetical protein Lal_00024927 [Lupinus albus]
MALTTSFSHTSILKHCSGFNGQVSSSNSSSLMGSPVTLVHYKLPGNQSHCRKQFVVFSRKLAGLEEAMKIKSLLGKINHLLDLDMYEEDALVARGPLVEVTFIKILSYCLVTCRERELQVVTKVKRRPPLRRGRVSPHLPVPDQIPRPPYVGSNILPEIASEHQFHDAEGIAHMRAACELAARVLKHAGTLVRPSVTTNEIDKAVHQMIIDAGAYPSPLGYGGFPKSVCTSVNECMCHGIPDSRQLQNGDIINIDVTVYLNVLLDTLNSLPNLNIFYQLQQCFYVYLICDFFNLLKQQSGYHGDTSKTFCCGEVSDEMKNLIKYGLHFVEATLLPHVNEECLEKGIAACKDGATFRKIGKRISEHAEKYGYGVVERFVGHGVGKIIHFEAFLLIDKAERLHFLTGNDKSGCMVEGETFTIGKCIVNLYSESEMIPATFFTLYCFTCYIVMYMFSKLIAHCIGQAWHLVLKLIYLRPTNCTSIAEPILTLGSIDSITWPVNWTTLTADGSAAAQNSSCLYNRDEQRLTSTSFYQQLHRKGFFFC